MFGSKELPRPLACQLFHLIRNMRACLESPAWITLQRLVGKYTSGQLHDGQRRRTFGSDHLDVMLLPS